MPGGFHTFRINDPKAANHNAIRDYIMATPGEMFVGQSNPASPAEFLNDPAVVGFSPDKGVMRVSSDWFHEIGDNAGADASAFATYVNTITATGRTVVVDEAALGPPDTTELLGLSIQQLDNPTLVHFYLSSGRYLSYEALDSPPYDSPFLTTALRYGCGVLCEMYVDQWRAERSGNMDLFIDQWLAGPADTRMPYLMQLKSYEASPSPIRFVLPVYDALRGRAGRRHRLPKRLFLDRLFQRCLLRYPKVFREGVCTWKWDSAVVRKGGRAEVVADLLAHYNAGAGAVTNGKRRLYTP